MLKRKNTHTRGYKRIRRRRVAGQIGGRYDFLLNWKLPPASVLRSYFLLNKIIIDNHMNL